MNSYYSYLIDRKLTDIYNDELLSLDGKANSPYAIEATSHILRALRDNEGWIYEPRDALKSALEGFIFDLLRVESLGSYKWLYRSLHSASFSRKKVGYKTFTKLFYGLQDLDFLDVVGGFKPADDRAKGVATRLRAKPALLALLASHGITPSNYQDHFQPVKTELIHIRDALRIREKKTGGWKNPLKGKFISVDVLNPKVTILTDQIDRLNAFIADADINGCTVGGFYRQFNEGNMDNFDFNKGGRLYALGNYQRMKREKRPAIRIDGEPVVEVDVSASHPFLFHAMMGVPLLPGVDPYEQCGIDRRSIAKRFVNMTLGNGSPLRKWPEEAKAAYLEDDLCVKLDDGRKYTKEQLSWLQRDYPIGKVSKAVLACFPLLSTLPESGITWADLQYRESLGLIATIEALFFKHGVTALPLHDSVIVPVSKAELAEQVLKECFWKEAGVRIAVKVKGGYATALEANDSALVSKQALDVA